MTRSRVHRAGALAVVALALVACGGEDERAMDDALRQDLWLASRNNPYAPYVSPIEQGYGYGAPQQYQPQPYANGYAVQPVARPTPVVQRAPATTRAPAPARAPETETIKNTKRDAIIGATAGAAIGAVSSRDKLKGAVIGAAAGGLLGAVIGNNVDVKKVPKWP